ncbi:serine protease [Lysobacter hankyongensis]|uniref:Serine protease n=1 Tax=Lysobacter hankyongensis TaxID=1176535 RepID=A0ABP9B2H9_9GAMM
MSASFTPNTFEAFKAHSPKHPYGENAAPGSPFPIHDPFGLRRAIVPVFQRNPDGSALGVGTAFHVDGWGRLLTADHVVDYTRERHLSQIQPDSLIQVDISQSPHAAVLLGYGLAFGTVGIPEACWAPINRIDAIVEESDRDPLEVLRGAQRYHVGPDLAGITAFLDQKAPSLHAVPVDFHWYPEIGETVFAVGYPDLDFRAMDGEEVERYLEEGMFGVYGTITNLFPNGRGRARPTPVFEVEAEWRSGMSGGPVFNRQGHVIGVVSYSLLPSEGEPGRGYATCFSFIPEASHLAPTLDSDNPCCRRGFGVYNPNNWHLADVKPSRAEAEQARIRLGADYIVGWVSHRLGGQDFMLGSSDHQS